MSWEQIKPFYPKDMGTKKGWCLQNVAKGFHAYPSSNPSASAKADMNVNIAKGTYHKGIGDVPQNCSVPVYYKTTSQYGHVVAYDKGIFYNDGKKFTPDGKMILGWGEWCNGYQIVKRGATHSFLPAKGYWGPGDYDQRISYLSAFMRREFPAYTSAKALGPEFGKYLTESIKQFQKRQNRVAPLYVDGYVGPKTYKALKAYGFDY